MTRAGTNAETLSAEFPRGTISVGTPADRAALVNLYFASYPNSTLEDFASEARPEDSAAWAVYRDDVGEIRCAMFMRSDSVCWVLARPGECEQPEVRSGFLRLAKEARAVLASYGVRDLAIVHAASLQPLCQLLEHQGFLSRAFNISRLMHFDERGEVLRTI